MKKIVSAAVTFITIAGLACAASAEDFVITAKDGTFEPKELTIPKDQKVTLIVKNEEKAPIEFESHQLKREKVVAAGAQVKVTVGPLKEGTYKYVDDFNEKNSGTIVAK